MRHAIEEGLGGVLHMLKFQSIPIVQFLCTLKAGRWVIDPQLSEAVGGSWQYRSYALSFTDDPSALEPARWGSYFAHTYGSRDIGGRCNK